MSRVSTATLHFKEPIGFDQTTIAIGSSTVLAAKPVLWESIITRHWHTPMTPLNTSGPRPQPSRTLGSETSNDSFYSTS